MINDFVLLSFHSISFYPILYQELCIRIRRLIRLPAWLFYRCSNCLSSSPWLMFLFHRDYNGSNSDNPSFAFAASVLLIRSLSLLNDTEISRQGSSFPHALLFINNLQSFPLIKQTPDLNKMPIKSAQRLLQ